MNTFWYYLIIINIIGFILSAVNAHTKKRRADKLLAVTALLGGSLGILISIFIFDRKSDKGNMMLRVFTGCVFVMQIVIFLFVQGAHGEKINFAFWEFFAAHKILLVYLCAVNLITFVAFAADKIAAVGKRSRIKIVTLLGLCFIGGAVGGLCAMYLFHHKTNKERNDFFTVGVPLMIVMHVIVIFYLMNL